MKPRTLKLWIVILAALLGFFCSTTRSRADPRDAQPRSSFVGGLIKSSDFRFKNVVPHRGDGPGGWKAACVIARMRDASTGNTWTCDFEAGVPEENRDGRVTDASAQSSAAVAANRSAWVVFNESQPPFLPAAVCVRFVDVMNLLLRDDIAGAKVTRCITRGLTPTRFGD